MSFNQLDENQDLPLGWKYVKVKEVAEVNEIIINKDYLYDEIDYIEISKVNKGIISESVSGQAITSLELFYGTQALQTVGQS